MPTPQPTLAPPKTRGRHGVQPRRTSQAVGDADGEEDAIDPRQRRETGERAGRDEPRPGPVRPDRAHRAVQRGGAGRAEHGEVVRGRIHDEQRSGEDRQRRRPGAPCQRDPQISIVTRYVSGTSSAERMTSGTVPATYVGPKTAIDAAATIEVSGIQCALRRDREDGRVGDDAPDLDEAPHHRRREAVPLGEALGDQRVVGGVREGRPRDEDHGHDPRHERDDDRGRAGRGPRGDIAAQSTGRIGLAPPARRYQPRPPGTAARVAPMNARWAVLVVFYLLLGLLGAWYLSGHDLARRRPRDLPAGGRGAVDDRRSVRGNAGVPEDYVYRYPPLLAMVIPVLGWPPLWFTLIGFATVVPMVVGYRVSGPAGLLPVALLVGAWGQQLLNGNAQAFVVALLAIVPLTRARGAVGLALATMLKIHPVLAIVWYAGRREWRLLGMVRRGDGGAHADPAAMDAGHDRLLPGRPGRHRDDPRHVAARPRRRRRGSSGPRRSASRRSCSRAPATAGCWRPSSSSSRCRACCSSTWRCCWRRRCLLGRRRARPNDPGQHRQPHRDEREDDQQPRERRQPARRRAQRGLDGDERPREVVDEGVRTGEDPGRGCSGRSPGRRPSARRPRRPRRRSRPRSTTPTGPSSPDHPTFAVNVRSSGSRRVSKNASHGSTPKISEADEHAAAHRQQRPRAKSRGRRTARYASTGMRCGFGMSTVSRPIATPPRGSCQRATARSTSTVIVLTLPMTRSWTIGGKASTQEHDSRCADRRSIGPSTRPR